MTQKKGKVNGSFVLKSSRKVKATMQMIIIQLNVPKSVECFMICMVSVPSPSVPNIEAVLSLRIPTEITRTNMINIIPIPGPNILKYYNS